MNFNEDQSFKTLQEIKIPKPLECFTKIIFIALIIFIFLLIFIPWRQTSKGFGNVIAIDPNNRTQAINANLTGRISKWYVQDGNKVKEGDKLVEIIDNDPLIIERLKKERDAKQRKYQVALMASKTSGLNYERQEDLYKKGLSSKKDFEEAKIEYKKLLGAAESSSAELAESETKLSRQESQLILAPKDGTILKILAGDNSTVVKAGDKIATFAPNLIDPAVELYVSGNDIPLIYEGRKVRLQFEGWPAIQFSGWPSVAIGTFEGRILSVDSSISENGKFRIIVGKSDQDIWPDGRFLRHGAKVFGWVLLNDVSLGYEIWRQINSFPPNFDKEAISQNYEAK
jgi:multidrug efflux pump subunit AcrA (membrane-fusion protein)